MRSLIRFLIFLIFVALLATVVVLSRRVATGKDEGASFSVLERLDQESTTLVSRVMPSVVSISARQGTPALEQMRRLQQLLGLGDFDGEQPELGSGAIVSPEGHIVTNYHVVAKAVMQGRQIDVQLNDGTTHVARALGWDPQVDLAVLKIEASGLTPVKFGKSDDVRVGQMVFAIGNPLGLQETVTQGIVSGKGRRAVAELDAEFFQTDAAVNPGNSGGPLVDVRGEVVGITNSVLLQSQGISFAIPSKLAIRVYEDVVKRGQISRPWFGAATWPLTPEIAQEMGIPNTTGNLVAYVFAHSPAERAGIRQGDVLQALNGKPVRDSVDIRNRLAELKTGDVVMATVMRGRSQMELPVAVEQEPAAR